MILKDYKVKRSAFGRYYKVTKKLGKATNRQAMALLSVVGEPVQLSMHGVSLLVSTSICQPSQPSVPCAGCLHRAHSCRACFYLPVTNGRGSGGEGVCMRIAQTLYIAIPHGYAES